MADIYKISSLDIEYRKLTFDLNSIFDLSDLVTEATQDLNIICFSDLDTQVVNNMISFFGRSNLNHINY